MTIVATAKDNVPEHTPGTATTTVAVTKDVTPPFLNVASPNELSPPYKEGVNNKIGITAHSTDNVGVKEVTVTLDGGAPVVIPRSSGDTFFVQIPVPDVAGQDSETAFTTLGDAGFAVREVTESSSSVSQGKVTRTDPPAGTLVARGATIDTYDDHRMAMCFSLVALGGVPVRINDPECVNKTFPTYFRVLDELAQRA